MKTFRFRLQRVLNLRETEESQARMDLAAAIRAVAEVEEENAALRKRILDSRQELQGRLSSPKELGPLLDHIHSLEGWVDRNEKRKQELEVERGRRAERYREARKDRKMLESLRDRRKEAHRIEMDRREAGQFEAFVQFNLLENRKRDEESS